MLQKRVSDLWLLSGTGTRVFSGTLSMYFRGLNKKHMEEPKQSAVIGLMFLSIWQIFLMPGFLCLICGIFHIFNHLSML